MTAILPDAAERIRAITELVRPRLAVRNVPGPARQDGQAQAQGPGNAAGPGTRHCASCGQADRLLIDTGLGTFVCLNIDRCQP